MSCKDRGIENAQNHTQIMIYDCAIRGTRAHTSAAHWESETVRHCAGRVHTPLSPLSSPVMDLIGGVGVPPSPPPPFCDEASQYASQKNPVTAFWVSQYFQKSCFPTMAYCIFCDMSQFTTPPPPPTPTP